MAEKTDLGRLAAPSLLRLVDEAISISGNRPYFDGKMSSEIWDSLDELLGVSYKSKCYLIHFQLHANTSIDYAMSREDPLPS